MEAYRMKIDYSKLFEKLKSKQLTQKKFRDDANISGATMQKLLHGQSVTTETICKICDFFNCMPDEIMEWIPDADYEKQNAEKIAIEAQIAELQAKLKTM